MKSFKDYLSEHYITTDSPEEKEKHLNDVHDMIRASYKSIGGYGGHTHGSSEESEAIKSDIRDPNVIMKLHRKNNKPQSVMLYKKHHGRKLIAAGTTGSEEGKKSFHQTVKSDVQQKRAWGEVSKKMETAYSKHGMPDIPSSEAERLTGKKIIRKHADGTHYDRLIGKEVHTKTIKGFPKQ